MRTLLILACLLVVATAPAVAAGPCDGPGCDTVNETHNVVADVACRLAEGWTDRLTDGRGVECTYDRW